MRIDNKEYIIRRIREDLYYYYLVDSELFNGVKEEVDKLILEDKYSKEDKYFKVIELKVEEIYKLVIEDLEREYKIKIVDINNFRESYLIERLVVLSEIIESYIY